MNDDANLVMNASIGLSHLSNPSNDAALNPRANGGIFFQITETARRNFPINNGAHFSPIDIKKEIEANTVPQTDISADEKIFNGLAAKWYKETSMLSLIRQKAIHPCYQGIIGMGKDALPFIFRELSNGKGDWMWALEYIVRPKDKIVPKNSTYKEAVSMWLQWGRDNGYFS